MQHCRIKRKKRYAVDILLLYIFETPADYHSESDESLVSEINKGSEVAFETLTARLKPLILHCSSRYPHLDKQEVYQDALILLYQTALKFNEEKCVSFRPYYLKVLHYRLIDWARKERQYRLFISMQQPIHEQTSDQTLEETLRDSKPSPESDSIYKELWLLINPVTLGLSPFEYKLLKHLLAGRNLIEVMELEEKSERIVRNAHARLRRKVLSQLMR
ncbi:sigma-70 family RNA polymerase sigma factor [Macrococcus bovicus]|uniref:Sigma-70 family RNA polymerase sigma factor n=1 Tax=Macrococcus bovicus TaxID=69968 RepID=A0A4R6BYJ9_9STAP|nr:sigma-70 family RNA polymerase sigma factor [Macrococcus bovicus]